MGISEELSRIYARDLLRLRQQVEAFADQEHLWQTLPGMSNAAGNLVLHLEGNLREYIGRQIGQVPYERNRPAEFATRGLTQSDLVARVTALHALIPKVLAEVPDAIWDSTFPEPVLGQPISNRMFVLHLLGHLNYHLGQLDCQRRGLSHSGAISLAGL